MCIVECIRWYVNDVRGYNQVKTAVHGIRLTDSAPVTGRVRIASALCSIYHHTDLPPNPPFVNWHAVEPSVPDLQKMALESLFDCQAELYPPLYHAAELYTNGGEMKCGEHICRVSSRRCVGVW
jgi:hypothetical protein